MSSPKEAHLFSRADYSPHWSPAYIDELYAPFFKHCGGAKLRGEATPIYMFLPDVAGELKRYNPALKLIVLLRDPAERAISNYYMQRAEGRERAPLWRALLAEPWRLWRCKEPRGKGSAYRRHSYRARGLYSLQLRNIYRHFPPRQVLVLSSRELLEDHASVLRRVFAFLGVEDVQMRPRIVLSGDRFGKQDHPLIKALLRASYVFERWRARGLYRL